MLNEMVSERRNPQRGYDKNSPLFSSIWLDWWILSRSRTNLICNNHLYQEKWNSLWNRIIWCNTIRMKTQILECSLHQVSIFKVLVFYSIFALNFRCYSILGRLYLFHISFKGKTLLHCAVLWRRKKTFWGNKYLVNYSIHIQLKHHWKEKTFLFHSFVLVINAGLFSFRFQCIVGVKSNVSATWWKNNLNVISFFQWVEEKLLIWVKE